MSFAVKDALAPSGTHAIEYRVPIPPATVDEGSHQIDGASSGLGLESVPEAAVASPAVTSKEAASATAHLDAKVRAEAMRVNMLTCSPLSGPYQRHEPCPTGADRAEHLPNLYVCLG